MRIPNSIDLEVHLHVNDLKEAFISHLWSFNFCRCCFSFSLLPFLLEYLFADLLASVHASLRVRPATAVFVKAGHACCSRCASIIVCSVL